ncbi:hypothetical protein ACWER6_26295 [Streptomyces sp. NPDC004009]
MKLWMSWTLDDVGSAGQTVDDVAAAVRALHHSVEQARRAFGSDHVAWEKLRDEANRVAAQALDEGRAVLERGQTWSLALGGVYVQLIPRGHTMT